MSDSAVAILSPSVSIASPRGRPPCESMGFPLAWESIDKPWRVVLAARRVLGRELAREVLVIPCSPSQGPFGSSITTIACSKTMHSLSQSSERMRR
jgi:hypothetical protein